MAYLLDTNICIYIIKRRYPAVVERLTAVPLGDVWISSITVAELDFGVEINQLTAQNRYALDQFLLPLIVVDFHHDAALAYGNIRAYLERQGQPIGALDMLIAAHALSLDAILVTHNSREFARVGDLRIENWIDS